MLTLTSPVETRWHRIPAGWKLGALALFSTGLMAFSSPAPLLMASVLVLALYLPCGPEVVKHGAKMLRPLWPFVLALLIFGWWDGMLAHAALISLRLLTLVAAANLATMTTPLSAMLELFEWLARPLARMIPPRRLALALALVIRFVPVMSETLARLREAWRARSPRRPGWRVVVPALLGALDTADRSADALRARGGSDGIPPDRRPPSPP